MIDISKVRRKFSIPERRQISRINSFAKTIERSFWQAFEGKRQGIVTCVKQEGKNKGQYGYYHNEMVGELYFLLKRLKINTICDLGSGAGILLGSMVNYDHNLRVKGIEIEESLAKYANRVFHFTTEIRDIFTLTTDDIKDYQAIYFWEPIQDYELCKKFVLHLEKILCKHHIIIYRPAGAIHQFLDQSKIIMNLHKPHHYNCGYLLYALKND